MSGSVPILVVDDQPSLRRMLRAGLAAQGFAVSEAATGHDALARLAQGAVEVALVDLGLPDMDGLEVIRRARASAIPTPLIVLSSRSDERGKVEAFELGADDFVTKPFGMGELVARIRTALRHRVQAAGGQAVYESGGLRVDLTRRTVEVDGVGVSLTNKEWDILRLLVIHAGKVLTHRALMAEVWGPSADVQYLRIYVRQLRSKLEADGQRPRHILTETGVGYRLQRSE